ncbi:hypothetical protein HFN89_05525 [Rhizobium laguerreae]|nr:hypothetical protein [Rhizobium laguerreae]
MITHEEQGLDYSDMVNSMIMNTWPIEGRDLLRDVTLLRNVVHDVGIVTYSVEVGQKVEFRHSEYDKARKAYDDL